MKFLDVKVGDSAELENGEIQEVIAYGKELKTFQLANGDWYAANGIPFYMQRKIVNSISRDSSLEKGDAVEVKDENDAKWTPGWFFLTKLDDLFVCYYPNVASKYVLDTSPLIAGWDTARIPVVVEKPVVPAEYWLNIYGGSVYVYGSEEEAKSSFAGNGRECVHFKEVV